jgi:putative PIN family toxin of toxin-antitoxin system
MRIVFDANALIGAARYPEGNAGHTLSLCSERKARLFVSEHLLNEVRRALENDFHTTRREAERTIAIVRRGFEIITPKPVVVVGISPADRVVIGTCLAAEADYLVTYDGDLLALKRYRHTRIVRPEELRKTLFKQGS